MAKTTLQQLKTELKDCEEIAKPPDKPPPTSRPVDPAAYAANPDDYVVICGNTLALRCSALSKRTKQRCKQPAMSGKARLPRPWRQIKQGQAQRQGGGVVQRPHHPW